MRTTNVLTLILLITVFTFSLQAESHKATTRSGKASLTANVQNQPKVKPKVIFMGRDSGNVSATQLKKLKEGDEALQVPGYKVRGYTFVHSPKQGGFASFVEVSTNTLTKEVMSAIMKAGQGDLLVFTNIEIVDNKDGKTYKIAVPSFKVSEE